MADSVVGRGTTKTSADVLVRSPETLQACVRVWRTEFPVVNGVERQAYLNSGLPVGYIDALFPLTVPAVYGRLVAALLNRDMPLQARSEMTDTLARSVQIETMLINVRGWWQDKTRRDLLVSGVERRLQGKRLGSPNAVGRASQTIVMLGYLLSSEEFREADEADVERLEKFNFKQALIDGCAFFVAAAEKR